MRSPDELWAITAYYNPNGFASRHRNFEAFAAGLKDSGVPWLVVECGCQDAGFQLQGYENVVRVRSPDVIWQKERLLNLALAALPASCTKVAWLDCDILFEDSDWADRATAMLDELPVIQPFSRVEHLPRPEDGQRACEPPSASFALIAATCPAAVTSGDFELHGHTGFAWAACRDWLTEHGLYDACIAGSADHLMAHALCGDHDSACVRAMLGAPNSAYACHFRRWAEAAYADVQGRIGWIDGRVLHLWHGAVADRHYYRRNQQLVSLRFDPEQDLKVGADGAWEWARPWSELHHWSRASFTLRNEDGAFTFVAPSSLR